MSYHKRDFLYSQHYGVMSQVIILSANRCFQIIYISMAHFMVHKTQIFGLTVGIYNKESRAVFFPQNQIKFLLCCNEWRQEIDITWTRYTITPIPIDKK